MGNPYPNGGKLLSGFGITSPSEFWQVGTFGRPDPAIPQLGIDAPGDLYDGSTYRRQLSASVSHSALALGTLYAPPPPAAPVVASSTQAGPTTSSAPTVNKPSGVAAGDLLVAFIVSYANETHTFSGWKRLYYSANATTEITSSGWYRIADGTEGSTLAASMSASGAWDMAAARITGADTTIPIATVVQNDFSLNSASRTSNPIYLPNAYNLLMLWSGGWGAASSTPSGMSLVLTNDTVNHLWSQAQDAAGSSGTKTGTQSSNRYDNFFFGINAARSAQVGPSLRSPQKTAYGSSVNNVTCDYPDSIAAGDALVAFVWTSPNDTINTPSGWTKLGSTLTQGTDFSIATFVKSAAGSESGTTQNFTWTGTPTYSGVMIAAYKDVHPTSPWQTTPGSNSSASNATRTLTGPTVTDNNSRYVGYSLGFETITSTPSGMFGLLQDNNIGIYDLTVPSGAFTNKTHTQSIAGAWVNMGVVLRPIPTNGIVQSTAKQQLVNGNTSSVSFGALPAVGNYVVVMVSGWNVSAFDVSSVTDNQGNTYTKAIDRDGGGSGALNEASIWYAKVNTSSGTFTITVNPVQTSGNYIEWVASEVYGMPATSPLDATQSNATNGSVVASTGTTAALAQADEIVFAVASISNDDTTLNLNVPSGYTEIAVAQDGNATIGLSAIYKIVSATTAVSATWSHDLTNVSENSAVIATFKLGSGAGNQALAGSLAAVSATTGALSKTSVLDASAAAVAATTGNVSKSVILQGSIAANSDTTGDLSKTATLAASAAALATATADISLQKPIDASVACASAASGILSKTSTQSGDAFSVVSTTANLTTGNLQALAASVASVASVTADISKTASLAAGVAAVTNVGAAELSLQKPIAGSGAGVASVSGLLSYIHALDASAASAASTTGALSKTATLAGSGACVVTTDGDMSGTKFLAASVSAQATATLDLSKTAALAGDLSVVASTTGNISKTATLAGSAAGQVSATADITVAGDFSGLLQCSTSVTAGLSVSKPLAADAFCAAGSPGTLSILIQLAGDLSVVATASATPKVSYALIGSAQSAASATADLAVTKPLAASVVSQAAASADMQLLKMLDASAAATSSASAGLSIQKPLTGSASSVVSVVAGLSNQYGGGDALVVCTGSADLSLIKPIAGDAFAGAPDITVSLSKTNTLATQLIAQAAANADISLAKPLAGSAQVVASASAPIDHTLTLVSSINCESSSLGALAVRKTLAGDLEIAANAGVTPIYFLALASGLVVRTDASMFVPYINFADGVDAVVEVFVVRAVITEQDVAASIIDQAITVEVDG